MTRRVPDASHPNASRRGPTGRSPAQWAPDAVLLVPLEGPVRGERAIHRYEDAIASAFPGATVTVSSTVVQGDTTAIEWVFNGVHAGPISLRGGIVPATGRRLTLRGASFIRFDTRGLIAEERRYYDVASVLHQLGVS
jgi:predicted ester cyclase